jgi:hypothetical protein
MIMRRRILINSTGQWLAGAAGLTAATYGLYAAAVWLRYGQHAEPRADERDPLLDMFMPRYEMVERHHVEIAAPTEIVMAAAREMDVAQSPISRAIFKARQLAMGAAAEGARASRGIIEETMALGWGVLADVPGREIVMGAVTKPWHGDVKFVAVPPDRFASFAEPGFVKIVWTLRADPIGPSASIFRTETRVLATDADARARFRTYWAFVSPGIWLIRRMTLGPLKADAERRAAMVSHAVSS